MPSTGPERFEDFKRSFSYGDRNDLAFKFLKRLSDAEAADFFAGLLELLGAAADGAGIQPLVEHYIRWQQRGYRPDPERAWTYEEGPAAAGIADLSSASIGLITSSGHFVDGDDPEPFGVADMTQEEAIERISEFLREPPELSAIPAATPSEGLRVRHGGYDIRGARRDPAVALPLPTLRGLARDGVIGAVADPVFSFVGATAQRRLLNDALPGWEPAVAATGADALLLVPL